MSESFLKVSIESVPHLSTDHMIEVDRAMMEDFHIELIQMMENAGRGLARLAVLRFFDGNLNDKRVIVLAGRGGNGGGALVARATSAQLGCECASRYHSAQRLFHRNSRSSAFDCANPWHSDSRTVVILRYS